MVEKGGASSFSDSWGRGVWRINHVAPPWPGCLTSPRVSGTHTRKEGPNSCLPVNFALALALVTVQPFRANAIQIIVL